MKEGRKEGRINVKTSWERNGREEWNGRVGKLGNEGEEGMEGEEGR